jgi:hypothetical protein
MPRTYTVEFEDVTVSAAVDLFEFRPATDKPIELVALEIAQNTELGDAAEEQLRFRIVRGNTTTGTGGATPTPQPSSPGDSAAGFGADSNNTTAATAGTAVNLLSTAFNVRVGYSWGPVPYGMGFWSSNATGFLVVRLMAAPADALDISATATIIEYP